MISVHGTVLMGFFTFAVISMQKPLGLFFNPLHRPNGRVSLSETILVCWDQLIYIQVLLEPFENHLLYKFARNIQHAQRAVSRWLSVVLLPRFRFSPRFPEVQHECSFTLYVLYVFTSFFLQSYFWHYSCPLHDQLISFAPQIFFYWVYESLPHLSLFDFYLPVGLFLGSLYTI